MSSQYDLLRFPSVRFRHAALRSGVVLLVLVPCVSAQTCTTEPASAVPAGTGANSYSRGPVLSSDGRFVAFTTSATNVIFPTQPGTLQAVMRDRVTGVNERISVGSGGAPANASCDGLTMSPDARFVAFDSPATNLVPGTAGNQIYLRDRSTGTTELISRSTTGGPGNNTSFFASISADGRFVAFESSASNLVSLDVNEQQDVFLRDRLLGTTTRLSVGIAGAETNGPSDNARVSADGLFVTFASYASNLVTPDTNGTVDVFVYDALAGVNQLVSVDSGGVQGFSSSYQPSISGDGRFVAFVSNANNLISGDTNGQPDIFVRDRTAGITVRASVNSGAVEALGASDQPKISLDGTRVAFESTAANLVPADSNGLRDVFLRDLALGTTVRVSVATDGTEANSTSSRASMTADGLLVAFETSATTLFPGFAGYADCCLRDVAASTTTVIVRSSTHPLVMGNAPSGGLARPGISSDGRYVAFATQATNLIAPFVAFNTLAVLDRQSGTVSTISQSYTGPALGASVSISRSGEFVAWEIPSAGSFTIFDRPLGTANSYSGRNPQLSDDGRYASFEAYAGTSGVYVLDRLTSTFTAVDLPTGVTAPAHNGQSRDTSLSNDGRLIVFSSAASNLVPGDTNNQYDIFLRDRITVSTARVSISSSGAQANGESSHPWISGDGRYVAFQSSATNLVANDTNGCDDIFVRDRVAGTTTRVSVSSPGSEGNQWSGYPSISRDGRYVSFHSLANNLVADDTNRWSDVFVHDRLAFVTRRVSLSTFCDQGDGDSLYSSPVANDRTIAFVSFATTLAPADTNGACDVLVRDCDLSLVCGGAFGLTFCSGDGSATSCPCGNAGLPGRGCENSLSTGGAALHASGIPSVAQDSVMLESIGMVPLGSVLFFQGTSHVAAGAGVSFGDGLRCIGGTVLRLAVTNSDSSGVVRMGAGVAGTPLTSLSGGLPFSGGTRYYQAWYRNIAAFCQPEGFNLSNGLQIDWTF